MYTLSTDEKINALNDLQAVPLKKFYEAEGRINQLEKSLKSQDLSQAEIAFIRNRLDYWSQVRTKAMFQLTVIRNAANKYFPKDE